MRLDRAYQRELLEELAAIYPQKADYRSRLGPQGSADAARYIANIAYLQQHGLVAVHSYVLGDQEQMAWGLPCITARGMDFLADDGGLSTILGVVTIRLHEDTLKELISLRISDSDLPAPVKGRLLEQIKSLPGEAIKHLTFKLVEAGLANWPIALQAIEHFVHAPG
ncbi:hypothetical protein [Paraburkholderia heleia]|uniref:hypothetical protein n=1 Tax=Paraburkholderia heleia TaxID=634127 RepID=UPI002AB6B6B7|nr:hypothetical protein [Paraburkholderia heleia]